MGCEPFPLLQTARLDLRCVTIEDAKATAALMTVEVSRWVARWPVPFTAEMALARIVASRQLAAVGECMPFAVVDHASGDLLGWAVLSRDPEDRRRGSFGYWLGEPYHGRGYMRELAPPVIAAGFDQMDLDVIEAGAQPDNAASFAIMRACGMKPSRVGMVHAPARGRDEYCEFYEIRRPLASPTSSKS
jgi:ribosomal-protein-alanine N-acetyltransferase